MFTKKIAVVPFVMLTIFASVAPAVLGATTQTLTTPDTENLEDTWIGNFGSYINNNYGSAQTATFQASASSGNDWIFYKWNVSAIPAGKTILNATWCGYITNVYPAGTGTLEWCSYHVNNQTWVETYPTYTNWAVQSNGTTNQTAESCKLITEPSNNTWGCLDVTPAFKRDYDATLTNFTMRVLGIPQGGAGNNETDVTLKEYGDASKRPYLNITYDEPETTTTENTTTTTERTTSTVLPSCGYPNSSCCFAGNTTGSCCLSQDYLYTQEYAWVNGTIENRTEVFYCENGCDSVLHICQPPQSMTVLYVIAGVVLIGIIWIVLRRVF